VDRRLAPLLLLLFVGGSCGPSPQEIGATILATAPIVHAITVGVLFGLCAAWRRHEPRMGFPWKPHLGMTAGLTVLALAWVDAVDPELLVVAAAIFGAGYLAVTVLAWRIAFAVRRDERSFLLPSLVAIVLCVAPAIALATGHFEQHADASDLAIAYWVILSGWGFAPFAVVIPCAVEAWWRGRRAPR
jgi:hypothetical protein